MARSSPIAPVTRIKGVSGQRVRASDPDLAKVGLVIGPVAAHLTQLPRMDPRFQLTYDNKLAAVFVARKGSSSARRRLVVRSLTPQPIEMTRTGHTSRIDGIDTALRALGKRLILDAA